ncbi:DeoR family transcriptional regulator [Cellulomonas sp. SG140]|uniref:DeoR family transcriptional regulator n=1 Tax=Cellulomonas sp. SG140 TaxID=2976536 RepID=UPI0021E7F757|nr:DeoR family transcriptional regulator [Cellulomonas sp. SG140]
MFGAERRQLILELVRAQGAVSIRDLAMAVNASEVTVRRDVTTLESRGLLDRSHGGALLPDGELGGTLRQNREPGGAPQQDGERGETLVLGEAAGPARTTMFGAERRRLICEYVRANRVVSLRDLAAAVNASEVTVRRDLVTLERQGLIERAHGGAQLPDALIIEPWPTAPPDPETTAKSAIAALAATLVGDATAIMLGAGTTVYELARRLAPRSPLTVLTNSMLVARALARTPNVELVMTRGSLDNSTLALVGSAAEHWIAGQRVTRAFVSGGGLTTERGLSSTHLAVSEVERAIVGSAKELVVLADHTKLGVESTYPVAPVTRIDHLVTDTSGDTSVLESLSSRGVHVHVAPSDLAGATA